MNFTETAIESDDKPLITVLSLAGDLDFSCEEEVEQKIEEILDESKTRIILDISEVPYASSSGLGVMLRAAKRLQTLEGQFAICCPQPMVADVLRLTRIATMMTVTETREAAIEALNS